MWIGVISLIPDMFQALTGEGVVGRGMRNNLLQLEVFNPRDYAQDRHRTVDDRPYGGGAGMVMMVEPLRRCLQAAQTAGPPGAPVVLLSPQGKVFNQSMAVQASQTEGFIFVCGRYEGLDERFISKHVDLEWSIGDFVVSGGEIPAMLMLDAIARHIPGVLGNRLSIIDESHLDGLLDYPQYTRPEETDDLPVPQVLMSGDHRQITAFRRREALKRTFDRRPELLTQKIFSATDRRLLLDCFEHEASHAKK
ncbi:MAG: tRNA (guanosine(37)-N1)-methyltransferase TrmD [Pseudomonadota bacterium]